MSFPKAAWLVLHDPILTNPSSSTNTMPENGSNEDVEAEMQRMIGFSSFTSTKGTQVAGNEQNWGIAVPKPVAPKPAEKRWTLEELGRESRRVLGVREPGEDDDGDEKKA